MSFRKVQGYEPFALNSLVKIYTEDQIKTDRKDVPRIKYLDGEKYRFHFPDIFIEHENKIIGTYKIKKDNVHLKANTAIAQGYLYEFWVYDEHANRINI